MRISKGGLSTLLFPLAALYNTFSMTALLLLYGLAGQSEIAADIALVQAASLALFYAFSANARNLILAEGTVGSRAVMARLLQVRLLLALPLAVLSFVLSAATGNVAMGVVMVLIVRRVTEWIGEIALAEHEVNARTGTAKAMVLIEMVALLLAVSPLIADLDFAWCALPWALAPLASIRSANLSVRGAGMSIRTLLPHVGSTAIIGAGVYIFRLSIILLAGKTMAGGLFTAFAIGGLIPTVLGQALVPTLIHRYAAAGALRRLRLPLLGVLAAGLFVTVVAWFGNAEAFFGHPLYFWRAVGLSLLGGAIMTAAAVLRASLIQSGKGDEVFGADMVANILIATCVPFSFYVLGPAILGSLYMLSAILSLMSFIGAYGRVVPNWLGGVGLHSLAALLVLPVFIQLGSGFFRDSAQVFDPHGSIMLLPLPLSIAAMFLGIAVLGRYAFALRALTVLFFTVLLFVATSLLGASGGAAQVETKAKLVLLAQFLMPMFALVLGQMYAAVDEKMAFERSVIWVLLLVLPAQLAATWLQGMTQLYPKVFFFSIYQHLQYFPMVVVALFICVAFAFLGERRERWILVSSLVAVTGIYVFAAQSIGAVIGFVGALVLLLIMPRSFPDHKINANRMPLVGLAVCVLSVGVLAISGNLIRDASREVITSTWQDKLDSAVSVGGEDAPAGLSDRYRHWKFYAAAIGESWGHFLIGHAKPPPRDEHPSAHNYWLDVTYNFGTLSLLPLLSLLVWTTRSLWRARAAIFTSPLLAGNACAVLYLVFFESMLKVGMRQPYPGIVTFFLWGLLMTRLSKMARESQPVQQ